MSITTKDIQELREKTGVGMMDCKKALEEAGGDINKAEELLRKQGAIKAAKKADRSANQGIITSYIHAGGKVGVLLELNCETDFVAKNEQFQVLAHDICLHIAASAPLYVSAKDISQEVIDKEKEIYKEQASAEGKPSNIVDKIVEGKLAKFYEEVCLLNQPYIKDQDQTIEELIQSAIQKIGENIVVAKFARYQIK
ncbi:MAG: hypothetical protein ACD_58C00120G0017 [uncultured bacterium]|nr:MAG: hypothetical protein ACD_58C00120G0017 [uncultured bacterium]